MSKKVLFSFKKKTKQSCETYSSHVSQK